MLDPLPAKVSQIPSTEAVNKPLFDNYRKQNKARAEPRQADQLPERKRKQTDLCFQTVTRAGAGGESSSRMGGKSGAAGLPPQRRTHSGHHRRRRRRRLRCVI